MPSKSRKMPMLTVCMGGGIFAAHMDWFIVTACMIGLVIFTMVLEHGLHVTEHSLRMHPAFLKMLSKMYKELMILGFVSFFLLLIIAGISSSISIIEAFTSAMLDKFSLPRRKVITGICVIGFCGSMLFATNVGLLWLDIVDHFLNQYGLITVGIVEALVVGWLYRTDKLKAHIVSNLGLSGTRHKLFNYVVLQLWMYCVRFIEPSRQAP